VSPSRRRVDIAAILADPERRRRLTVTGIQGDQAREGIDTNPEQAERAYRIVTERERVAFFKLLPTRGPDSRHERFLTALGGQEGVRFDVPRRDFDAIEGRPLAYEQLQLAAYIFRDYPALEPAHGRARLGPHAGRDERYVRQWWEVRPEGHSSRFTWERFAKGGDFSRFYADVNLVVHWDPVRQTFADFRGRRGRETERPESVEDFFRPGLTWPRRTQRGFNLRILPEGCVFADKGPAIFPRYEEDIAFLLGVMNSRLCEYMLRALTSFGSWEVGAIKRVPIPTPSPELARAIGEAAMAIHDAKRRWDEGNETSTTFSTPWVLDAEWIADARSLPDRLDAVLAAEVNGEARIRRLYEDLNDLVFDLHAIRGDARIAIEESRADAPAEVLWPQLEGRSRDQKRIEHVWRLLSHAVRRAVASDQDGIVSLNPCADEPPLVDRVRAEVAALLPESDPNQLEIEIANELNSSVPGYRRTRGGIPEWLEDVFYSYHAALYRSRPILWHIASAAGTERSAFSAVVDYHRFDRDRMAKLRGSYVRDAIETCRREAALSDRADDADQRLTWQERREEIERLDEALAGVQEGRVQGKQEGPGDLRILTPWKGVNARPRGWDPDLDDGVVVNIGPLARAGVLRAAR
jgi:hypothetical protein